MISRYTYRGLAGAGRPVCCLSPHLVLRGRCTVTTTGVPATFDEETDVLVIGSGAGGLTAALRAQSHGLRALVVEKDEAIGGSSAYSGGAMWIPNTHLSQAAGVKDSKEDALKYLEATIGDVGPVSSRERKVAFLENGPRLVEFLEKAGFQWRLGKGGCPDYFPEVSGGSTFGRTLEPKIFDMKKLGSWRSLVRKRPGLPIAAYVTESNSALRSGASWSDFNALLKILLRQALLTLLGQAPSAMGQALVSQLLYLHKQAGTQIQRKTALVDLIMDGSTVVGATVKQEGAQKTIRASRGVLLAAGGFAHNKKLREKWGPSPASVEWTSAPPGDTGDAITAAMKVGAGTALLDDAWWGPTVICPLNGQNVFALTERARPFSIIVDSSGSRFMNEAEPYTDAGHHQYERHQSVKAIPAWLIVDHSFRKRYSIGGLLPLQPDPKNGLASGHLFKADTIQDLARQIDVDPAGLEKTLSRFNKMARAGVDEDFHRGVSAFDKYFGDPNIGPNPSLGPIEKPPFYAARIYPGDLGTKGGLLTDEFARVLRDSDGKPIERLYAAGNTSASVMGRTYSGAGATIAPAMTFSFIAVDHMASRA
ncbi:Extracellular 3-ketosteroid 1-dehydrogenase [Trichophyton interdigitale]|uniref:Extracellular 3-ketosteroid 1-dehydrogenase n=1 Tax=Trichophyton interdigitale TaxID=101480 RepID=A0A9P4YLJ9_9EURO|nr:Extracellular 3-ketosteroid 1-dehydrogenase [Trichophyton interdigitale]KAF3899337.1 Extracellular 3-ketosteroid 1-dehydrogenase [Trichophyton interdigitale]KAG8210841.1 Extracellular 3-ketosteroid 1-dehydrogenase [Trichophyton interdigitale]